MSSELILECSVCGITHSSSFHSLTFDFSEYPLTYLHIAFFSERLWDIGNNTLNLIHMLISEGVFRNLADFCLSDRISKKKKFITRFLSWFLVSLYTLMFKKIYKVLIGKRKLSWKHWDSVFGLEFGIYSYGGYSSKPWESTGLICCKKYLGELLCASTCSSIWQVPWLLSHSVDNTKWF